MAARPQHYDSFLVLPDGCSLRPRLDLDTHWSASWGSLYQSQALDSPVAAPFVCRAEFPALDSCGEDHLMIRQCRERGALLLVAFSLLVSVATAYAECAWVLWHELTTMAPTGGTPASEWTIIQAGSAEKACAEAVAAQVRARADFWKSPARTPKPDPKPARDQTIEVFPNEVRVYASSGYFFGYRFLCLPDGTDPRGPKAK
jgi:hypothetical protein